MVFLRVTNALRQPAASSRRLSMEVMEARHLLAAHLDDGHDYDLTRYDEAGNAFYFDPAPDGPVLAEYAAADVGTLASLTDLPILHSNPSAAQKIYLDFDGQVVSNTNWNNNNNGRPIHAPAYDTDGDGDSFSARELRIIDRIWERVAEDFAPFDVDVTTEEPSFQDLTAGKRAIRVLISSNVDERTGNEWFGGTGGIAYIGSWRWRSDTPVWVFAKSLGNGEKRVAEGASHEIGHAFGLGHDGVTGGEQYYRGHGSGRTGWAPIMGVGYDRNVTQWSSGEYAQANNRQDDLRIIASARNEVRYRRDDHSSTTSRATELIPDANFQVTAQGIISKSSDQDMFSFQTGAGLLDIDIDPARRGPNLDIEATLFDADGNILATSNSERRLNASIRLDVPAGEYFLRVDGVGKGDPATDGYSDYASLGQYTIDGQLTPVNASVVGRRLFYDNSYFDNFEPGPSDLDAEATAPDKRPLLPGEIASFQNYSSYHRGINGLMIDISHLRRPGEIDVNDFEFRVGRRSTPETWNLATPPSLQVQFATGDKGADRIVMTWEDGDISNTWLQVIVKANDDTGLSEPDVFYFGSAIGEIGDSWHHAFVDGTDFVAVRDNARSFVDRAAVTDRYDLNRDSFVDGADLAIVRDNVTNFLTSLPLIAAPQESMAVAMAEVSLRDNDQAPQTDLSSEIQTVVMQSAGLLYWVRPRDPVIQTHFRILILRLAIRESMIPTESGGDTFSNRILRSDLSTRMELTMHASQS